MKTITLKTRRTLASIMVWVLMLNSVPMMDWVYAAQNDGSVTVSDNGVSDGDVSGGDVSGGDVSGGDVSGGDVSGGDVSGGESNNIQTEEYFICYPEGGLFSVSDGEWVEDGYTYVVEEESMPDEASINEDGLIDISKCSFSCNFVVNKLDSKKNVVKKIIVRITAYETKLVFNHEALKEAVSDGDVLDIVYGTQTLDCEVTVSCGDGGKNRPVKYSVSEGADIAEIDSDGMLTFKSNATGKVVVVASVDALQGYAGEEVSGTIKVDYEDTPSEPLVYCYGEGDSKKQAIIKNGAWFNHHGVVRVNGDYEWLDSNELGSGQNTDGEKNEREYTISADGTYDYSFYLRNNETGGMTDVINWSFGVDTVAPVLEEVEFSQWYGAAKVDENGNNVGGIPYISDTYKEGDNNRERVKLYFSDKASLKFTVQETNWSTLEDDLVFELVRVEEIKYGNNIVGYNTNVRDTKTSKDWKKAADDKRTLEYIITEPGLYYVKITCNDNSDNPLNYRTEFIYVETSSTEKVAVKFEPAPAYAEDKACNQVVIRKDGDNLCWEDIEKTEIMYFGRETKITLSKVNGGGSFYILDSYDSLKNEGIRATNIEGTPKINEDGLHIITMFSEGFNKPIAKLIVDNDYPAIEVDQSGVLYHSEGNVSQDGFYKEGVGQNGIWARLFYKSDVKFTFKVTEEYFLESGLKAIDHYDGDDNTFKLEWEKSEEENVWIVTGKIPAEQEGEHRITFTCTDKAGLSTTYVSEQIVIDNVQAQLIESDAITYSADWLTPEQVTWDNEYEVKAGYVAGTSETQKLYYGDTLKMTIKIHKKNYDQNCIVFEDLNNPNEGLGFVQGYDPESKICTITYVLPETAIGTYQFQLKYMTADGKEPEFTWTSEIIEMVDVKAPELKSVTITGWNSAEEIDGKAVFTGDIPLKNADELRLFAKDDVTVIFTGTETNEDYTNIKLVCDDDNNALLSWKDLGGTYDNESGEWTITYTIPKTDVGEHVLKLTYKNEKQNGWNDYTSPSICIDTAKAELKSVSCGDWVSVEDAESKTELPENEDWSMMDESVRIFCNSAATVVFEICEENFRVQDLEIVDDYGGNKKKLGVDKVTNCGNNIVKVTCTIPYSEKGDHRIFISYKDRAGNVDENGQASVKCTLAYICMDEIEAKIESVSYSAEQYIEDIYADSNLVVVPKGYSVPNRRYYNDDVEITFVITEDNLRKDGLILYNGNNVLDITPEINSVDSLPTNKWSVKYTLDAQGENAETEYVLSLAYEDRGGSSTKKKTDHILIDITPAIIVGGMPTFSSDWVSAENLADNKVLSEEEAKKSNNVRVFYKDDMTITFVIQEKNFRSEDVQVLDNGVKVDELSITANDKIDSAWDITYSIPVTGTGDHIVTLNYQDKAKNDAISYTTKCICMDNTAAVGTADGITYSQWVTAEKLDETQGKVEDIESGATESVRRFYSKDMTISFVIEETNFREDDVKVYDKYPNLVDRTKLSFTRKSATEDIYIVTYSIPAKESGEHVVTLEYQDRALNGEKIVLTSQPIMMDTKPAVSTKESVVYSSWKYAQDTENGNGLSEAEVKNKDNVRLYYGADMTVSFVITEENFRAADVTIIDQFLGADEENVVNNNVVLDWSLRNAAEHIWTATYKVPKEQEGEHIVKLKYQDRSKNTPAIEYETKSIIMDITAPKDSGIKYKDAIYKTSGTTAYFNKDAVISFVITEKNFHPEGIEFTDSFGNKSYTWEDERVDWVQNETNKDIWTVTYTIPVKEEGKHNVMLKYTDPSQNEPVVFNTMDIVIDKTVVGFSYELISTAGLQYEDSDKKCFCKDDLTFVFRFQDDNFERDYVTITDTYNGSSTNVQFTWDDTRIEKENEHVAVYVIPATAEGTHIITMNSDDPVEKVHYTSPLIIMDKTNPELMGVTYSDCVVEEGTADSFDEHKQVTVYNNEDVTVTFEIKEANFYEDDVRLNDSYNNTTGIELEWEQRETDGIWFAAYTIPKGQEGKHVLDLYYQDRSKNKELTYVSKTIVIDTIAAKLESVGYSKCTDTDEETSGNSIIRYYSNNVECESGDAVEVTFKVLEKYFHEAGVSVSLSKDDVIEPQCNWSWKSLGNDEYEITCFIPKSEEGDYVITFSYQDRCKNGPAINVVSDIIRIDNQAATFNVTYSEFVSARKVENGAAIALYQPGDNQEINLFYNQDVILTFEITEKHFYPDDVEFADNFDTSINKSILQWKPVEGKTDVWRATYKIPNTAEGTHKITLFYQDRSKNTPAINYASENIIVDKTAADLKNVTFGGKFNYAEDVTKDGLKLEDYQPASREDVILYYNKDMSITFEITEANFYEKDVIFKDSYFEEKKITTDGLKWERKANTNVWVATYTIPVEAAGEHIVILKYRDRTENEPYINYTSECIIMDSADSELTSLQYTDWSIAEDYQKEVLEKHNAGEDINNVRLFYKDDMTIVFEITEDYFHPEDVELKDTYYPKDKQEELYWTAGTAENSNVWTASYTIPASDEGEHRITLTYGDRSGNKKIMYTSEKIMMDITAADLTDVTFSAWKQAVETEGFTTLTDYAVRKLDNVNLYYDDTVTMKFTITEVNFNENDVSFKDNGEITSIHWNKGTGADSNIFTAEYTIPKSEVGEHIVTLEYQDRSLNEKIIYMSERVIIDMTEPTITLTYKDGVKPYSVIDDVEYYGENQQAKIYINEKNFRATDVVITIDTTDAVGVVDVAAIQEYLKTPMNWTKTSEGYVAYVDLNTDARYYISITYKDLALREAQMVESSVVVDNQKPVEHLLETDIAYDAENCKRMVDENNHTVTTADADTRFIYQGAMTFKFALKEINFDAEAVVLTVIKDKTELGDNVGYSYAFDENWSSDKETYIHTLTLELGKQGNDVVDGDYQVRIDYIDQAGHRLDTYTSNIIKIDKTNPEIQIEFDNKEASEYSYSNSNADEPYYYDKDRNATITIKDRNVVPEEIKVTITAKDVTGEGVPFNWKAEWKFDENSHIWTAEIPFNVDANYELGVSVSDMATNGAADSAKFTVDKTAPDKESFKVIYSDTVKNDKESDSNNAFYKDIVTVKISIEDATSRIYGFKMTYRKQKDASSINKEEEIQSINYLDAEFKYEDKRTASATFRLTAEEAKQYRGNLYFEAIDMAGNHSEEISDAEKIVIVDSIVPTRTVEYSPASQVVNKESLNTINVFNYATENAPVILLYNSPMEITFKINEANFYEEDIILEVNKKSAKVSSWKKEGDLRIGKLKIVEDGEYTVTLQYTDRSTNKMVDYTSHTIIVDTAKPQIYVSYSPDDVKQQIDGIKYYDKQQTATITINERNFRASDVEVVFSARDINGNSVGVPDYDSILKNKDSWSKVDDNHVAKITFAIDANYEFDIMYKDLALISSDDYVKDVFTVDQTAPTNVSVSYSVPVFEKTLQGTDYKYYNEPVVVTLVAEDETSPIHSFDYSYMRAEGVSTVNAEGIANRIDASKITYSNGRKTATATFVLPASELRAGTQINGGLEYAATNRASLTTELKDMKRYVVDSIAPTVNVEFSDCVKQANNISYYAGNIDVTINIEEANFFSEDVKVRISKDGGEQTPVEVSWRTLSVDRHVGNFKLEEEGDYRVYISYQDSSTNKIADYQSNQLTIDRTKPSVTVSGIRHNSANKKSQIGYVVKVEDVNLDINTFNPKLIAEIRNEAGNIEQIDCTDIGTVDVIVEGKSCTYTITNIKNDGIYHFESSVSDMSGNTTNEMVIEGIVDKVVSVLEYSVNRNGSTYGLEDGTKGLNNRFVKEARDVIVYETNPDEISNIVITLFKNDKSIVLVEGKDYVVNKISKAGEWFKYEYIIYATNFMEDGTYHISIYSEDKAGNIAENNLDVKNVEINFGVDKTLPKVIVTNLESKQTYPVDKLSVLMQATDNMKLVNIMVELDGKLIASWDEEQIIQMGADLQDFVFDIIGDSTHAHTVTITLTDVAGNQCIETISDFYVTTNLWVQFVNNKLLFYGSIAAVIGGGIVFIPLWRRRRRRREARG